MKIVVIGGAGLIGSKLVAKLREHGHEAVAAGLGGDVDVVANAVTGEGLAEAVQGADTVVDVTNAPSFEEDAATEFFRTTTGNLQQAEVAAGVKHHVALSVVGTEELAQTDGGGYFRAKLAQERLIAGGPVPYSIVHATQFFEFLKTIADVGTQDGQVRIAPVLFQPMAADDVAAGVGRVAAGAPVGGITEIGGPDVLRLDEAVRARLAAEGDPREVVADQAAGYFGMQVTERVLVPGPDARLGEVRLADWLRIPANAA